MDGLFFAWVDRWSMQIFKQSDTVKVLKTLALPLGW